MFGSNATAAASVVRARVVITAGNLIELRDVLNRLTQQPGTAAAGPLVAQLLIEISLGVCFFGGRPRFFGGLASSPFFGLGWGGVERRRFSILASTLSLLYSFADLLDMPAPSPPLLEIPTIQRARVLPPGTFDFSPRVTMSQLRKIGAVAVAWAKLENCLNDLTWTIQGKDLAAGRTQTEDLDISRLLVALQNAMQTHLIGPKFSNERRSIVNLIEYVNATKSERNIVIHGTWAEASGIPVVGSLRADTPHPGLVTFESYPGYRLDEIRSYATNANATGQAIISRLESLRRTPSPQRP